MCSKYKHIQQCIYLQPLNKRRSVTYTSESTFQADAAHFLGSGDPFTVSYCLDGHLPVYLFVIAQQDEGRRLTYWLRASLNRSGRDKSYST